MLNPAEARYYTQTKQVKNYWFNFVCFMQVFRAVFKSSTITFQGHILSNMSKGIKTYLMFFIQFLYHFQIVFIPAKYLNKLLRDNNSHTRPLLNSYKPDGKHKK